MPIYEYRCLDCDEEFEALLLNKDDEVSCSSCHGSNIEKQFSSFGVKSQSEAQTPSPSAGGSGCRHSGCGCGVRS
ncbi:MAG: zinc ribbon domain-containing protein [Candidatus Dadabacteria bacterium]|nr:zinc ribbon domain-containing protein [Candidatus Dadabacteria bacterium]